MEERHLHFNVIQYAWFLAAIIVGLNFLKFVFNKWRVAGLTDLINNT